MRFQFIEQISHSTEQVCVVAMLCCSKDRTHMRDSDIFQNLVDVLLDSLGKFRVCADAFPVHLGNHIACFDTGSGGGGIFGCRDNHNAV